MTKEIPLQKILKKRKLTLRGLYLTINGEINITRLSDIRIGRITPTNKEIQKLDKYLNLTEDEIEGLENMEIDRLLIENNNKINNLLSLVPKDLKAGQEVIKECPNCRSKLSIARSSLNGHLWIVCEKEGVLVCQ